MCLLHQLLAANGSDDTEAHRDEHLQMLCCCWARSRTVTFTIFSFHSFIYRSTLLQNERLLEEHSAGSWRVVWPEPHPRIPNRYKSWTQYALHLISIREPFHYYLNTCLYVPLIPFPRLTDASFAPYSVQRRFGPSPIRQFPAFEGQGQRESGGLGRPAYAAGSRGLLSCSLLHQATRGYGTDPLPTGSSGVVADGPRPFYREKADLVRDFFTSSVARVG